MFTADPGINFVHRLTLVSSLRSGGMSRIDRMDDIFTFADGLAAGMTRRQLRACDRVARGVLVRPGCEVSPALIARGALHGLDPAAYASHTTAARVLGLPVGASATEHVTVPDRAMRRVRAGRTCHHRPLGDVWTRSGVRISSPRQVFAELAPTHGLVDLVALGDAIVRRGWATPTDLWAVAATPEGARAAGLVRTGVDSVMETRARLLLILAGLPEPETNHIVRDEYGEPIRQHDLYYRRSRTVIEYDGRLHIEREARWHRDLGRREDAESAGDRVLVLVSKDVHGGVAAMLARVHSVLLERGEPGVPAVLSQSWRRYVSG